jgi:hypothetical protein
MNSCSNQAPIKHADGISKSINLSDGYRYNLAVASAQDFDYVILILAHTGHQLLTIFHITQCLPPSMPVTVLSEQLGRVNPYLCTTLASE